MNLLRNAFSWLLGHVRLAIEYALLGGFVVLGAYALWQRTHSAEQDTQILNLSDKLTSSTKVINGLVEANADQDKAISDLRDLRARDADAILGLQKDIAHADARNLSVRAKLAELEKNNARAKELLDTAVPPDVGCVLDGSVCPADGANQGRH